MAANELQSTAYPTVRPRTQLTAQDLIYAASTLRAEARRVERQAGDPQFESSRNIFECAARAYDELPGNLTQIADTVGPPDCLRDSASSALSPSARIS